MKTFFKFFAIILCFILMAAHLSRADMIMLSIISLLFPFILLWKHKISAITVQIALGLFGLEWIRALVYYARIRVENGEDWLRLALILGTVAIINFATILVYRTRYMKEKYK